MLKRPKSKRKGDYYEGHANQYHKQEHMGVDFKNLLLHENGHLIQSINLENFSILRFFSSEFCINGWWCAFENQQNPVFVVN